MLGTELPFSKSAGEVSNLMNFLPRSKSWEIGTSSRILYSVEATAKYFSFSPADYRIGLSNTVWVLGARVLGDFLSTYPSFHSTGSSWWQQCPPWYLLTYYTWDLFSCGSRPKGFPWGAPLSHDQGHAVMLMWPC